MSEERPDLSVLHYISPAAFGPHHLEQLQRLARFATDGTTAVEWARRIAMGEVWLWEVEQDERHAVILTSTLGFPPHTLFIEGAAGNGIVARGPKIVADLRAIASFYGATRLQAVSKRDGFASLPEHLGFEAASTIWELEIGDGQQRPEGNHDNPEG